ncbi:hypothetical protein PMIN06_000316 [Paraphaeosphaeria minitans]
MNQTANYIDKWRAHFSVQPEQPCKLNVYSGIKIPASLVGLLVGERETENFQRYAKDNAAQLLTIAETYPFMFHGDYHRALDIRSSPQKHPTIRAAAGSLSLIATGFKKAQRRLQRSRTLSQQSHRSATLSSARPSSNGSSDELGWWPRI